MSNDPRENLHGSDGQELADVTAAAEQTGEQAAMHMATSQTPAQSMADALAEMSTPSFEETLSALVWLRENGTLRGRIIIDDCGMDDDTRETARLLARRWDCVDIGWDGEEWTNTKN